MSPPGLMTIARFAATLVEASGDLGGPMKRSIRRIALGLALGAVACSSIAPLTGVPAAASHCPNLRSGTWTGTSTSSVLVGLPGEMTVEYTFTDGDVQGTITPTLNGIPIQASLPVSGSVICDAISFAIVGENITFDGVIAADGNSANGSYFRFAPYLDSGTWTATVSQELPLVSVGSGVVLEGDAGSTQKIHIPVTLSQPGNQTISVAYQLVPSFAAPQPTPGEDYLHRSGTVRFPVNTTTGLTPVTKWVTVTVLDDEIDEQDESLFVVIGNPVGAKIDDSTGAVTIVDFDDSDNSVQVSFTAGSIAEGDPHETSAARRTAKVTVALSRPAVSEIRVEWTTGDATAVAPSDYIAKSGVVKFAPGQVRKTLSFPIVADDEPESDETFVVYALSVSGPAIESPLLGGITIMEQ